MKTLIVSKDIKVNHAKKYDIPLFFLP